MIVNREQYVKELLSKRWNGRVKKHPPREEGGSCSLFSARGGSGGCNGGSCVLHPSMSCVPCACAWVPASLRAGAWALAQALQVWCCM